LLSKPFWVGHSWSKISFSKQPKHPFNKSLLVFTDFFTVNAHPHNPDKRSVSHQQWMFLHSRL